MYYAFSFIAYQKWLSIISVWSLATGLLALVFLLLLLCAVCRWIIDPPLEITVPSKRTPWPDVPPELPTIEKPVINISEQTLKHTKTRSSRSKRRRGRRHESKLMDTQVSTRHSEQNWNLLSENVIYTAMWIWYCRTWKSQGIWLINKRHVILMVGSWIWELEFHQSHQFLFKSFFFSPFPLTSWGWFWFILWFLRRAKTQGSCNVPHFIHKKSSLK